MSYEAQAYYSQQFEHIIATIFTCRSVVKYNLNLTEDQKMELLGDIDMALEVLRAQMFVQPTMTPQPILPPTPVPDPYFAEQEEIVQQPDQPDQAVDQQALEALYRMYHAYMDESKSTSIVAFVARFNDVMETINQVQQHLFNANTPLYDGYTRNRESSGESLHNVKVFVADIYYIFMEFMRVLSDALQLNNVHLNTDKLFSMNVTDIDTPLEQTGQERSVQPRDIVPLLQTYATHQQLERVRGRLASRVQEGSVVLDAVKEGVGTLALPKRDEVLIQLGNIGHLLSDMEQLLTAYEQATTLLLDTGR